MPNYFALNSIVFMMAFVLLFDGLHRKNRIVRMFRSLKLLSLDEVNQLQVIWSACQDTQ